MKLPECHSRRELPIDSNSFFCAHPQVHAADGQVTAQMCLLCDRWQAPPPATFRPFPATPASAAVARAATAPVRDPCFHLGDQTGMRDCRTCRGAVKLKVFACAHPLHDETTIAQCRTCPDYDCRLTDATVRSWAVGVTTARRERETLERTLTSLAKAGWTETRLFAEPESPIPPGFAHLAITRHDRPLGAWPNFFLGLSELALREPHADAYFMLQDDVVFCTNLRAYLERSLWPAERLAIVSPYCSADYASEAAHWRPVEAGWNLIGALTCIFPNAAARSLLSFARAVSFRQRGPFEGRRNVDSVIGAWAKHHNLPVYFHSPSLALHVGETSVAWPNLGITRHRQAKDFVGEEFDATTLPAPPGERRGEGASPPSRVAERGRAPRAITQNQSSPA